jgi:hypothetical protein
MTDDGNRMYGWMRLPLYLFTYLQGMKDKTLEDVFYEKDVQSFEVAFESQMHFGMYVCMYLIMYV